MCACVAQSNRSETDATTPIHAWEVLLSHVLWGSGDISYACRHVASCMLVCMLIWLHDSSLCLCLYVLLSRSGVRGSHALFDKSPERHGDEELLGEVHHLSYGDLTITSPNIISEL